MVLASIRVLVVERAPRNGCHQCLYPQDEFQLPLPLWEALQDQQVGLTGVSISHRPLALPKVSPASLSKPNILGAYPPDAGPLGCGTECCNYPPVCGIRVLPLLHLCSPYLSCGSSLISSVGEGLFWQSSGLSHQ